VLVAAAVALVKLLVGAADALLDARRPLAALGVGEGMLVRVPARQPSATAVRAVVAGAPIGGAPASRCWARPPTAATRSTQPLGPSGRSPPGRSPPGSC
jgi:hypothetical protein